MIVACDISRTSISCCATCAILLYMQPKDQALKLRMLGYSYSYISEKTGLSKSTLSYHLALIPYVPNKTTIQKIGMARTRACVTKSNIKKKSFSDAKRIAKVDIGNLSKRDLFMLGLGVYIGEGSKTQDIIRLVNCDYRVLNLLT